MRKGKYQSRKRGVATKSLALILTLALLVGGAIGGTIAWLTADGGTVTNTFTDSDINITLTETDTDTLTDGEQHNYKMIPGWTIDKDPTVAVVDGSEDCWLFVKIDESTDPDLDTYITYAIASGWQTVQSEDTDGVTVIGRRVYKEDETKSFAIIGYTDTKGTEATTDDEFINNKVLVNETVTKELMDAIDGDPTTEKQPTLEFTAYAVQLWKTNKPSDLTDTDAVAAAQFDVNIAWTNAQTNEAAQGGNNG